jgi:vacuolar-type H+-ATPase subunit I/STV1
MLQPGDGEAFVDERHRAILEQIGKLAGELFELSARAGESLPEEELDVLTRRLQAIRTEIDRLREEFRLTLN